MTTIKHTRDTTANDSDKIVLTCPDNKIIEILQVHVVYTSTSTVGNRQVIITVQDENDTLINDIHAGAVQAASLIRHYNCMQGVYRETSFVDGEIQVPIPIKSILLPGWDLRIYEDNAVDAAADDMTVNVMYREGNLGDVNQV